jgi:hypothetical protein
MPERPRPILSHAGEPGGATDKQEPAAEKPRLFSAVKLKDSFRAVAKAVITELAPKPTRRRKRGEDTRGLFKKLAMKILGHLARATRREPDPWYMPPIPLDETQRWLMREQQSQNAFQQQEHQQAFHYDQRNHLSPRF